MAIRNFTHLDDTGFPYPEGIDPYKYENDFNYSQYDKTQMRITVCSVPWDVGLIHVGNAQIGGLGNVVKFESPEARDEWLDSIENKYTWETKYREYHTDGYIEVPLPYEKAVLFNYAYVEYDLLPVDYAEGSKKRFFFFIRECQSLAPSNCKIKILRDTFQTFIYDVDVTHLMLERGHAPMAFNSADRYLSNPVENNEYLLAEDINFGNSYKRAYATSKIFNSGDMWAVVVSSGNPRGDWGSKEQGTWTTPGRTSFIDGQPSYFAIALDPANLYDFLQAIDTSAPQFKSTIKGVFFIAKELVSAGAAFSFVGYQVRPVSQKSQNIDFINLTKSQFNYGPRYENLAKLYTFPYAYLEITGEDGNANIVKIEETSGDLSLFVTTSLAYPWIAIDSHINGIGAGGSTIEFSNVNEHSFTFAGDWYSQLRRWSVPCFAVTQSSGTFNDYNTHFDRVQKAEENLTQQQNSYDNAGTIKANSDTSALTAKTNADESSDTAQTNADATALTSKTNADANADTIHTIAYRDAETNKERFDNERLLAMDHLQMLVSRSYPGGQIGYDGIMGALSWQNITKISDDYDSDFLYQQTSTAINNEYLAASTTMNSVASGITMAFGGAAAGVGVGGPAGGVAGAVAGTVAGAVSIGAAGASIPVAIGQSEDLLSAAQTCGNDKTGHAVDYIQNTYTAQAAYERDKVQADETRLRANANLVLDTSKEDADDNQTVAKANALRNYNTDIANNARTHTTSLANNQRTYNTDIANNLRSYNTAIDIADRIKQTSDDGILNSIKQHALEAPQVFGAFQDGETSVTRPQGIFCNIVTQSKDAIAQAGDYFLRFGYAVNRAWDFTDFNIMPKFTYWKASDMWISGNNVPDAYLDEIRFFFLGGVCVWRRPEDIGNISIYENN